MSYDIDLFKPLPGETLERTMGRAFPESEEINPGPPSPEKEALKELLAAALTKEDPRLERFAFGYKEIAETLGTDEGDARLRWRHVELNGPVDGGGVQITLFDDTASIAIPYWHEGEKAEAVFKDVWEYIRVFRGVAGYVAYDRQLERVVGEDSDLPDVLRSYGRGVHAVGEIAEEIRSKGRRPWWKFW